MKIPIVHNHARPDGIYPFAARGIAKRFRHDDRAGRSRGPFGDATLERDAGASVAVAGIPCAGRSPCGGPSADASRRPLFGALDALNPGERMRCIDDRPLLPRLQQIGARYGEGVEVRYLERGAQGVVIDFILR